MDNITALYGLQASSKNSVVSQSKLSYLQNNLYIESNIDEYIIEYCLEGIREKVSRLVVLSGNAGDGKSMTLFKIKEALIKQGIKEDKIIMNADATQTESPSDNLIDNLRSFFNNFLTDHSKSNDKIYLIAMNVGIAIKFFNSYSLSSHDSTSDFQFLKQFIFNELNIERLDEYEFKPLWQIYNNDILVVNFDLRTLVHPNFISLAVNGTQSFFRKMLDKLYKLVDIEKCKNCESKECPIYFNLISLKTKYVADRIENILFKVFLYNKVHLTPRNVWDFLYHLITGGETKYIDLFKVKKDQLANPCDLFHHISKQHYSRFLFFNNLFDSYSDNAILRFINTNIEDFDPIYLNNKELEIFKILSNSNEDYLLNIMKSKANYFLLKQFNENNILEKIFCSSSDDQSELAKNTCRFMYFLYNISNGIPDILTTNHLKVMDEDYFVNFYKCLVIEKNAHLDEGESKFPIPILKMLRTVLLKTLGTQLGENQIIQLNTVSTRGKGKLLEPVQLNISQEASKRLMWKNIDVVKHLDYFPSSFTVEINDTNNFQITLDLFELMILADNGYNVNSIDLDRFNQFEMLRKGLVSIRQKNSSIFYEIDQQYFKLTEDFEMEFKKMM